VRRAKGTGTQRPDGTWESSVTLADAQGRKVRKTVKGATQKELLDNIAALRLNRRVVPVRTQTIEELYKAFLDERFPEKTKGRKHHEFSGKRLVRDLGNIVAGELSTPDVAKWLRKISLEVDKKGNALGGRSIQVHRNNLSVLLDFGRELGWVRENAARGVRLPRGVDAKPQERPVLTPAMCRLIRLKETGPVFYLLWWFLTETGARISEALRCRREHVRREKGVFVVDIHGTKSKAAVRTIPIPYLLGEALLKQEGWLFPAPEGGKGDVSKAEKAWRRVMKATPIPYTNMHQLRKARITQWVDMGLPDTAVKYLAGHSSILVSKDVYHRSMAVKVMQTLFFAGGDHRYIKAPRNRVPGSLPKA
jgi:integrase